MLLRDDRLAAIAAKLDIDGRVIAADLSAQLGVPVDTIRRDLRDLATRGACRRVYGGALRAAKPSAAKPSAAKPGATEPGADDRSGTAARSALAAAAIGAIGASQVVFVDAGRTNLAIAAALPRDLGVTIVTGSPAVAAALVGRRDIEIILAGGRLDHASGCALGKMASDALRDFRFDLCLLGACAVAAEGLSAFDIEDAALKRQVAAASGSVLVAVTADKVGTRAPFAIGPLTLADRLLVEAGAPEAELARLRETGVDIEMVEADA